MLPEVYIYLSIQHALMYPGRPFDINLSLQATASEAAKAFQSVVIGGQYDRATATFFNQAGFWRNIFIAIRCRGYGQ
jgi:hypothetical protein